VAEMYRPGRCKSDALLKIKIFQFSIQQRIKPPKMHLKIEEHFRLTILVTIEFSFFLFNLHNIVRGVVEWLLYLNNWVLFPLGV